MKNEKIQGTSRLSAIRVVINWSSMSNLTDLVMGIVTNEPHYAKMERNLAYSLYCARLNGLAQGLVDTNSELVASGVNAMYARREDPIGAVAVDKLLAALKPGYYNGAERCACALSLLANENSSSECISYFANVTNGLNSADR